VFVALIVWGVVDAGTGASGTRSYHGPAVLIIVLAVFSGIVGGLLVAVIGGLVALATRSARVEAAHQQLMHARDLASSPTEVAEVQAAAVPGRRWRRWLASAWWTMPAVAAYILSSTGMHSAARLCLVLQLVLVVALVVRVRVRRVGGTDSTDAPACLEPSPAREAGVRETASLAGWVYEGNASGRPQGAGQDTRNMCTGVQDGVAFRSYDEVHTIALEVNGRPAGEAQVAPARSVVLLSFPAVFQLAVVPAGDPGQLGVSAIGPLLHLESNEFETRYHVYCDDPVRGRMVLNPAVMALILDAPLPLQVLIRMGVLQVATSGTLLPPAAIRGFVRMAVHLRQSAASATTGG
jgi:hypothetical protein